MSIFDPAQLAHFDQLKAAADADLDEWLGLVAAQLAQFGDDAHDAVAFIAVGGIGRDEFRRQSDRFFELFMAASIRLARQRREGQQP